jgi:hypothetical protein
MFLKVFFSIENIHSVIIIVSFIRKILKLVDRCLLILILLVLSRKCVCVYNRSVVNAWSEETEHYQIGMCCLSAKHSKIKSKITC